MPVERSPSAIVAGRCARRSGPTAVYVPPSTVCIPPFAGWSGSQAASTPALRAVLPKKVQDSAKKGQ